MDGRFSTEGAHLAGRVLLLLGRTRATGSVRITTHDGPTASLVLSRGVVVAAQLGNDGPLVGDLLARLGALDASRHADAWYRTGAPPTDVGAWLVSEGATTEDALRRALLWQARVRLARRLAQASGVERTPSAPPDARSFPRPVPVVDLVLGALRTWEDAFAIDACVARLGSARARLSGIGREALAEAALWPEERAFLDALATGATLRSALRSSGHAPRAARFAFAAATLGFLDARSPTAGRYALLARKRFELGARRDARTLLDLDSRAPAADARRALRRLARSLHPDALGPDAPDDIRRAANEVLGGIATAARTVR